MGQRTFHPSAVDGRRLPPLGRPRACAPSTAGTVIRSAEEEEKRCESTKMSGLAGLQVAVGGEALMPQAMPLVPQTLPQHLMVPQHTLDPMGAGILGAPKPPQLPDPGTKAGQGKRMIKKCEHGRQKSQCKDCHGSGICEHDRQKRLCKDCGGSGICEHKRIKNQCRDCGGSGICEHKRRRSRCKDCGGVGICEHGQQTNFCRDCQGPGICTHGRRWIQCKDCGGTAICPHKRRRIRCKECGGSAICEHGKQKSRCRECGGSELCEHKRIRSQCKECGGKNGRKRNGDDYTHESSKRMSHVMDSAGLEFSQTP